MPESRKDSECSHGVERCFLTTSQVYRFLDNGKLFCNFPISSVNFKTNNQDVIKMQTFSFNVMGLLNHLIRNYSHFKYKVTQKLMDIIQRVF